MCDRCKCISLLKRKGISITILRRYVIKVLTLAGRSLTPPEILRQIQKFHPINKVTLYRILRLLEKKAIVKKILTISNVSRYALIDPQANGNKHLGPHFICMVCEAIIPIDSLNIDSILKKKLGSKFRGPMELTIEGICPKCRKEVK
ncbi:MAG: transcriptional repressor [Candidatus Omnitrophica bacterium]|nr:transcriptional repressor [Candidatus Omnitrophota bacterium]